MSDDTRVPGWVLSPVATVREILGNNRRAAYLGLIALGILWYTGNLPSAGLPSWWPAVAIAIVAAYIGARWAARKILDLIPEPPGILIVEFRADEPGGGAIYELSEEAFEDMDVVGDLFAWDESPRRVYEVWEYDPAENIAIANWRESEPGSAIAANRTVDDAFAAIRSLREDFEPDVAKARELRRRFRGIVRALDADRAEAQQQILDNHLAPDLGGSRSIDDVIEESMPDVVHPTEADSADDWETSPATDAKPSTNGSKPEDSGSAGLGDLGAVLEEMNAEGGSADE